MKPPKKADLSFLWIMTLGIILLRTFSATAQSTTLLPYNWNQWYYSDKGSKPANDWFATGYTGFTNAALWKSGGQAPLGYKPGTTLIKTEVNSAANTVYFRTTISISNVNSFAGGFVLKFRRDDGIAIYVNGTKIQNLLNDNLAEAVDYSIPADEGVSEWLDYSVSYSAAQLGLVSGNNVIAVELHQYPGGSNDFNFDMELTGLNTPPTLRRSPHLYLTATNSITIRWGTDIATESVIKYGTSASNLNLEKRITTNDTAHIVTLDNLNFNTHYYYSIGYYRNELFEQPTKSESVYSFKSPPHSSGNTTKRIWILGDAGAGDYPDDHRQINVREAYRAYSKNQNPDLLLFTGDNTNNRTGSDAFGDGTEEILQQKLFAIYPDFLKSVPMLITMGNHDYEKTDTTIGGQSSIIPYSFYKTTAASFSAHSFPPTATPGQSNKGYYSVDYGDIHFVVINPYFYETGSLVRDGNHVDGRPKYKPNGPSLLNEGITAAQVEQLKQIQWLRSDLAKNKQRWTVVACHIPSFSSMDHLDQTIDTTPVDPEVVNMRTRLLPILEEAQYHVDLFVVAHTHAYSRAGIIRNTGSTRKTDFVKNGNLGPSSNPYTKTSSERAYSYVLMGNSGRGGTQSSVAGKAYLPNRSILPLDSLWPDVTQYYAKGGSVELTFNENRMDMRFIREAEGLNPFVVADSFTVFKDVNTKTTKGYTANYPMPARASWPAGTYRWTSSATGNTVLSTKRDEVFTFKQSTTLYVRDSYNKLADTIIVNISNPDPNPTTDIIPYNSTWVMMLGGGSPIQWDLQLTTVQKWTTPAYSVYDNLFPNLFKKGIIGFGNGDEQSLLANESFYKLMPFSPFKNIITLSSLNATGYKLSVKLQKDIMSVKNLVINEVDMPLPQPTVQLLPNNRQEVTYILPGNYFAVGQNYIALVINNQEYGKFPQAAYTFDARLTTNTNPSAPALAAQLYNRTLVQTADIASEFCTEAKIPVQFTAFKVPDEPAVYNAWLFDYQNNTLSLLGKTTESPVVVTLPDTLINGGTYKIRVLPENVFSDYTESAPFTIVKTSAVLTDNNNQNNASIYRGQSVQLLAKFTGLPPWNYTFLDGTSGTTNENTITLSKSPSSSVSYTLSNVTSSCGQETINSTVNVAVKQAATSFDNWQNASLCAGNSFPVNLKAEGPSGENRTYIFELSNANGDFTKPTQIGTSTLLSSQLTLPDTLSASDKYRLRAGVLQSQAIFESTPTPPFSLRIKPQGTLKGSNADSLGILTGDPINLKLDFTGSSPWNYVIGFGISDTLSGRANTTPFVRTVQPKGSTVYTLRSVSNVCGEGKIAGKVTITLITALVHWEGIQLQVYPNPTTDFFYIHLKNQLPENIEWELVDNSGRILLMKEGENRTNYAEKIEMDQWPSNMYYLRLKVGSRKATFKIVKQ